MKLIVFQYLSESEIKKTRTLSTTFQSKLVQQLTLHVNMVDAIRANNLNNMKWIKERFNKSTFWHYDINFGTFLLICVE